MTVTFALARLHAFARDAYLALGLPDADAALVADSLVQADAWGHASHGVMRTFWYGARIETGAKAHGIGAVAVRASGHFWTAMYFTRMAAAAGCIGFLSTNASPAMAPWGGREKRLGTNPWSLAAPAGAHPPMLLDLANTAVARGKLYVARQRGESIPEGWAIDEQGRATTDPALGIAAEHAAVHGVALPEATVEELDAQARRHGVDTLR